MATWVWVLIIVAVAVVIIAALVAMATRKRRTTALRQHFGPEYDRTVQARENRRSAEADLRHREEERSRLDVKPLPEQARARYAAEWHDVQERFVDQPSNAVAAADGLVTRVMGERGYPMENFEQQAKLVSVDHPHVVDNYRVAHHIFTRAQSQRATTEDLREAMLRYRSLFDELLQPDGQPDGQPDDRSDTTARRHHSVSSQRRR